MTHFIGWYMTAVYQENVGNNRRGLIKTFSSAKLSNTEATPTDSVEPY